MVASKRLRLVVVQTESLSHFPADGNLWQQTLDRQRFEVDFFDAASAGFEHIDQTSDSIDCLVLVADSHSWPDIQQLAQQLCNQGLLVPTVLVLADSLDREGEPIPQSELLYHNAIVVLDAIEPLAAVNGAVDQAIALFLQTSPICMLPERDPVSHIQGRQQQRRLAENLRERLGYLGVYYKRSPTRFYRYLSEPEQDKITQRLRGLYQAIVLDYYQKPNQANRHIDEFVALAFFADLSISQVLELHMKLMDDYAKQLKIEGRSEEILLDYRITLIDVIAHLSELYRRSIPRESTSEARV